MKTVKHFPKAPNTLKWGKRVVDIAKDEGVSRSRIYQRIERHGSPFAKDIVSIHNIGKPFAKDILSIHDNDQTVTKTVKKTATKTVKKVVAKNRKRPFQMSFNFRKGVKRGSYKIKNKKVLFPVKPHKNIIKWGKSIANIALDEGVTTVTIYKRIERHGSPFAKDIGYINMGRPVTSTYNKWGKRIADIAKDEGVTENTIYKRIQKNGTPFKY